MEEWIIIAGKKYDVSEFKKKHPGGEPLLSCCIGIDATDIFTEFHTNPAKAQGILSTLPVIETVSQSPPFSQQSSFCEDIRLLRNKLKQEGKFCANPYFYLRKYIELCLLFGFASQLLYNGWWYTSSMVMGLFFQQCGWLSHDIEHNQVTSSNKTLRTYLLRIFGNICQGFSGKWWVQKHMTHHAMPNALHEQTKTAIDEDFDTVPLLYWTSRLFPDNHTQPPWHIRWQGYYLWLLLPWSKFLWDYQSLRTAIVYKDWTEMSFIFLHYVVFGLHAWILQPSSLVSALAYMMVSRIWGGFFISWVFIQSHNGMEYYTRDTVSFYEAQTISTRNISLDTWTTWFTGGLNYQIEHHLFPTMPRHYLPSISKQIQTLFRLHNMSYVTMGLFECSRFLTRYLNRLGRKKEN